MAKAYLINPSVLVEVEDDETRKIIAIGGVPVNGYGGSGGGSTPDAYAPIKKIVFDISDSSMEQNANIFEWFKTTSYIYPRLQEKLNILGEALYKGEPVLIYQAVLYGGNDDYETATKRIKHLNIAGINVETESEEAPAITIGLYDDSNSYHYYDLNKVDNNWVVRNSAE